MKKVYASVLITNFNKEKYIQKTLKSCELQSFKEKEVLIFDDCSTDNSLLTIKKFKNFKLFQNKRKKYNSGPQNQIYGLNQLIKKSKGEIIFLLDSDDEFKKSKLLDICKLFKNNKKLDFIQDTPLNSLNDKKILLKERKNSYTIWPRFYPASTIVFRKRFFEKFKSMNLINKFPNLEIDARMCIYAHLTNKFKILNKSYTKYNLNTLGITSKYKKFSRNWWIKRCEAFDYMQYVSKKLNLNFYSGPDFYITKFINLFF